MLRGRRFCTAAAEKYFSLKMPDITIGDEENDCELTKWHRRVGDLVKEGDTLCSIESPSFSFELEADKDGYLAQIQIPKGSRDIPLGKTLCTFAYDQKDVKGFEKDSSIHNVVANVGKVENLVGMEKMLDTIFHAGEISKEEYDIVVALEDKVELKKAYEKCHSNESEFNLPLFIEHVQLIASSHA